MTAVFLWVWAALMALLAATLAVYWLPLGPLNLVAAIAIALAKTALVAAYFMHVRSSPRVVWVWSAVGFYWLGIMVVLTQADYLTR
jgi:cytochrome c oxidase subunit 4